MISNAWDVNIKNKKLIENFLGIFAKINCDSILDNLHELKLCNLQFSPKSKNNCIVFENYIN